VTIIHDPLLLLASNNDPHYLQLCAEALNGKPTSFFL
jgi:hypothetical protein